MGENFKPKTIVTLTKDGKEGLFEIVYSQDELNQKLQDAKKHNINIKVRESTNDELIADSYDRIDDILGKDLRPIDDIIEDEMKF